MGTPDRNSHAKGRALAELTFHVDCAPVQPYQFLNQGQPDARSLMSSRAGTSTR